MIRNKKTFRGILFIMAGLALLLNKLGYFPEINLFRLIFTIFLLELSIKNIRKKDIPGSLFPIALIAIIYSSELGIEKITPWTLLITTSLISIGLSIIFNKGDDHINKKNYYLRDKTHVESKMEGELIEIETSFSETIKYLKSDNFKDLYLDSSFGSMKLYFDNVSLLDGQGTINIDAVFSGIELYIPKEWTVIDNTSISFGGVNEKNRGLNLEENTLRLIGSVSFAGVDIIYI